MTLGEKIYRLRVERGLSQEAFGEKLGVSRQSVSKWETDQSVPELDKVVLISEIFEVSTDYLLKDEIPEDSDNYGLSGEENIANSQDKIIIFRPTFSYEYRSEKMWRGMPLVHVSLGFGKGMKRAKGVIAIGNIAEGIVAIGLIAKGLIALAPLAVGLLAIGVVSIGMISFGSLAVGIIAMGAVAIGLFSMGAITLGQFCFGALAFGKQVAIGDEAYGKIALGFSKAAGEVYEEVNAGRVFHTDLAIKAIDENVAGYWSIFKSWIKGIIRLMYKG